MELQRTQQQRQGAESIELPEQKRLVPWRRGRTLLLVEDDLEMRRMLAAALRRDGHVVIEAANGDDALDWLGPGVLEGDLERVPDVVVSDIRLPYFTGLEILESLQVSMRRIPVILITGFPDRDTYAQAAELGAACVLEKPFDLGELRAAVHVALRGNGRTEDGTDDAAV